MCPLKTRFKKGFWTYVSNDGSMEFRDQYTLRQLLPTKTDHFFGQQRDIW